MPWGGKVPKLPPSNNVGQDVWLSNILPRLLKTFDRAPNVQVYQPSEIEKKKKLLRLISKRYWALAFCCNFLFPFNSFH
jgi:hypothetical protein